MDSKGWNEFEPLLNIEEVAKSTGLKRSFIKRAIARYDFPHYKIGRLLKFRISSVNEWVEKRRKQAI